MRGAKRRVAVLPLARPAGAFAVPETIASAEPVVLRPSPRPALLATDPAPAREEQRRGASMTPANRAKAAAGDQTLRARLAKTIAANEASPPFIDQSCAVGSGASGEIDAIAFRLLMETSRSNQSELRSITGGPKAIDEANAAPNAHERGRRRRPDDRGEAEWIASWGARGERARSKRNAC